MTYGHGLSSVPSRAGVRRLLPGGAKTHDIQRRGVKRRRVEHSRYVQCQRVSVQDERRQVPDERWQEQSVRSEQSTSAILYAVGKSYDCVHCEMAAWDHVARELSPLCTSAVLMHRVVWPATPPQKRVLPTMPRHARGRRPIQADSNPELRAHGAHPKRHTRPPPHASPQSNPN